MPAGSGLMVLWDVNEAVATALKAKSKSQSQDKSGDFSQVFKNDMKAVGGCLSYTAVHAEETEHKALAVRQNEARGKYQATLRRCRMTKRPCRPPTTKRKPWLKPAITRRQENNWPRSTR